MINILKSLKVTLFICSAFVAFSFKPSSSNDLMTVMKKMMEKMNKMEMTNNFDKDFSMMMAEHHQGAIDMANILQKSGKDGKLKGMAQKSSAKQKEEKKKLIEMAGQMKAEKTQEPQQKNELIKPMESMMNDLEKMKMTGDVDKDFANMMIRHHKSGIELARAEISHGKDSKLKEMAQKMVSEQEKEITELQNWLAGK